jgi:hypothetical protein
MCITIGKDRIMCRIDPAIHDEATGHHGVETVKMRGLEYKGYVYVHEDAIRTTNDFNYWIKLALDFNKIAKASKKK